MRLTAIVIVFVLLFVLAFPYCFKRRRISERPGSYSLLVAGLACAVALVSVGLVEGSRFLRRSIGDSEPGTGDLLTTAATDPSAAGTMDPDWPEFPHPAGQDVAAWQAWSENLRGYLVKEVYGFDFGSPLRALPGEWLERETNDDGLTRREYSIPTADGDSLPAVLLLPSSTEAVPGIVLLPGHVDEGKSGLAQLVLPMRSFHNSAARQLALAGFATLTIELRGFGMRGPPDFPDHLIVAYNAILAGSFYKKIAFDEVRRAFNLLGSLPEVDPERLGISGVSLGAELAVEYAALDTRVKAISFHSHGGRVGPYTGHSNPAARQPHYCHLIPGSGGALRHEDPFLLLAPRPTQGVRGEEQPFRQAQFEESLGRLWAMMGHANLLELQVVPGPTTNQGHAYFVEQATAFFSKHL